jgi:hypothetical protein
VRDALAVGFADRELLQECARLRHRPKRALNAARIEAGRTGAAGSRSWLPVHVAAGNIDVADAVKTREGSFHQLLEFAAVLGLLEHLLGLDQVGDRLIDRDEAGWLHKTAATKIFAFLNRLDEERSFAELWGWWSGGKVRGPRRLCEDQERARISVLQAGKFIEVVTGDA